MDELVNLTVIQLLSLRAPSSHCRGFKQNDLRDLSRKQVSCERYKMRVT